MQTDPKNSKRYNKTESLFCAFGICACKMLMKLTSEINFINILSTQFLYVILAPKITKLCFGFEIFGNKISYKKRTHKTLMKLTPGCRKSDTELTRSLNILVMLTFAKEFSVVFRANSIVFFRSSNFEGLKNLST